MPPAASICIMSEVPERGRPETIVIMAFIVNGETLVVLTSARMLEVQPALRSVRLPACRRREDDFWSNARPPRPECGSARLQPTPVPLPICTFRRKPRERIAIASYPFREFIAGKDCKAAKPMDLKDFAAHIVEKFQINKIEPWTGHFPSTDAKYLEQFRAAVEKARSSVVNIAVDGEHSPYALDRAEREQAIVFSKKWVDNAVAIGSPCIRTNLPAAKDSKPDLDRTAESLTRVIEYASAKNIVVSLENDNPVSEDPFFLASLVEK